MRYLLVILILSFFPFTAFDLQPIRAWHISGQAQGTTYHITYYAIENIVTQTDIDRILNQIDSSLSIYKKYSLISRFNAANSNIVMDQHLAIVVNKAKNTFKDTEGVFDITVQPLVQAWGFGNAKIENLPDSLEIQRLKACVGSDKIRITDNSLFKMEPCIRIDVNGIAQGYSVDVLATFFDEKKIDNYIVELGGEIRLKGRKQPSGERMRIGIEAPGEDLLRPDMLQRIISLDQGAITTSGSYRKYYESNGNKISHIIDPRSGYPAQNDLVSVTVYAQDAMTADAYDNALMVMGLNDAMKFIEQRKEMAAYFIYRGKDGNIKDTASDRFYRFF